MTHIDTVKLVITLDDGSEYTLVDPVPDPVGDNPRFISRQFNSAIRRLGLRGTTLIYAAYPGQIAEGE